MIGIDLDGRRPGVSPSGGEGVPALVAWLGREGRSLSTGAVFDLSGGRATY